MANLLPNNVPNLQQSSAIVNQEGQPSQEFVRWINDTITNIVEAINYVNAQQLQLEAIVTQLNNAVDQIVLLIDQQNATTDELATKAPLNNPTFTGTVSGITKGMVGLGNVDNTADLDKPISTATQAAIDLKLGLVGGNLTGDLQMNGNDVILASGMLKLKSYTVGGLPSAGTTGRIAVVTDALAPVWGATVAGGGSTRVAVLDDGTNWVVM